MFESKYKEEILQRANSIIDNVITPEKENLGNSNNPLHQKKLKDKQTQIINLYFKVLEELLVKEESKTKRSQFQEILKNENFHKALIACSIETVFFVNNYSDLTFPKLLELCKLQAFEFWRMIASFIKFDSRIPSPIQRHFYSLEVKILMYFAWQKDSIIHQLVNKFLEHSKAEGTIIYFISLFNHEQ